MHFTYDVKQSENVLLYNHLFGYIVVKNIVMLF